MSFSHQTMQITFNNIAISMEQSYWQTNSRSTNQEISRLLWNPKFHYRVHNSPPLDPVLSQINSVRNFSPCSSNIILLSTPKTSKCPFPSDFPTKFCTISHHSDARYITRLSHPHYCHLIIFGDACKLWNSSLCSFLQFPATSSLLGPNVLFSTLSSDTFSLCSFLTVRHFHYTDLCWSIFSPPPPTRK
jgi:hypothetical protein